MQLKSYLLACTAALAVYVSAAPYVAAERESCECRELKRIREAIERLSPRTPCTGSACQPVPTPTAINGGPLE